MEKEATSKFIPKLFHQQDFKCPVLDLIALPFILIAGIGDLSQRLAK
jgi:hypothetical protein